MGSSPRGDADSARLAPDTQNLTPLRIQVSSTRTLWFPSWDYLPQQRNPTEALAPPPSVTSDFRCWAPPPRNLTIVCHHCRSMSTLHEIHHKCDGTPFFKSSACQPRCSYANQATTLESVSATPSPESEERKALQDNIATEIKKLKSENHEMEEGLEAAEASQEVFRSQVLSLKEVNMSQENDIESLWVQLFATKERYN